MNKKSKRFYHLKRALNSLVEEPPDDPTLIPQPFTHTRPLSLNPIQIRITTTKLYKTKQPIRAKAINQVKTETEVHPRKIKNKKKKINNSPKKKSIPKTTPMKKPTSMPIHNEIDQKYNDFLKTKRYIRSFLSLYFMKWCRRMFKKVSELRISIANKDNKVKAEQLPKNPIPDIKEDSFILEFDDDEEEVHEPYKGFQRAISSINDNDVVKDIFDDYIVPKKYKTEKIVTPISRIFCIWKSRYICRSLQRSAIIYASQSAFVRQIILPEIPISTNIHTAQQGIQYSSGIKQIQNKHQRKFKNVSEQTIPDLHKRKLRINENSESGIQIPKMEEIQTQTIKNTTNTIHRYDQNYVDSFNNTSSNISGYNHNGYNDIDIDVIEKYEYSTGRIRPPKRPKLVKNIKEEEEVFEEEEESERFNYSEPISKRPRLINNSPKQNEDPEETHQRPKLIQQSNKLRLMHKKEMQKKESQRPKLIQQNHIMHKVQKSPEQLFEEEEEEENEDESFCDNFPNKNQEQDHTSKNIKSNGPHHKNNWPELISKIKDKQIMNHIDSNNHKNDVLLSNNKNKIDLEDEIDDFSLPEYNRKFDQIPNSRNKINDFQESKHQYYSTISENSNDKKDSNQGNPAQNILDSAYDDSQSPNFIFSDSIQEEEEEEENISSINHKASNDKFSLTAKNSNIKKDNDSLIKINESAGNDINIDDNLDIDINEFSDRKKGCENQLVINKNKEEEFIDVDVDLNKLENPNQKIESRPNEKTKKDSLYDHNENVIKNKNDQNIITQSNYKSENNVSIGINLNDNISDQISKSKLEEEENESEASFALDFNESSKESELNSIQLQEQKPEEEDKIDDFFDLNESDQEKQNEAAKKQEVTHNNSEIDDFIDTDLSKDDNESKEPESNNEEENEIDDFFEMDVNENGNESKENDVSKEEVKHEEDNEIDDFVDININESDNEKNEKNSGQKADEKHEEENEIDDINDIDMNESDNENKENEASKEPEAKHDSEIDDFVDVDMNESKESEHKKEEEDKNEIDDFIDIEMSKSDNEDEKEADKKQEVKNDEENEINDFVDVDMNESDNENKENESNKKPEANHDSEIDDFVDIEINESDHESKENEASKEEAVKTKEEEEIDDIIDIEMNESDNEETKNKEVVNENEKGSADDVQNDNSGSGFISIGDEDSNTKSQDSNNKEEENKKDKENEFSDEGIEFEFSDTELEKAEAKNKKEKEPVKSEENSDSSFVEVSIDEDNDEDQSNHNPVKKEDNDDKSDSFEEISIDEENSDEEKPSSTTPVTKTDKKQEPSSNEYSDEFATDSDSEPEKPQETKTEEDKESIGAKEQDKSESSSVSSLLNSQNSSSIRNNRPPSLLSINKDNSKSILASNLNSTTSSGAPPSSSLLQSTKPSSALSSNLNSTTPSGAPSSSLLQSTKPSSLLSGSLLKKDPVPSSSPKPVTSYSQPSSQLPSSITSRLLGNVSLNTPGASAKKSELREYVEKFFTSDVYNNIKAKKAQCPLYPSVEVPPDVKAPWRFTKDYCGMIVDIINEMIDNTDLTDIDYETFTERFETAMNIRDAKPDPKKKKTFPSEIIEFEKEESEKKQVEMVLKISDSILSLNLKKCLI